MSKSKVYFIPHHREEEPSLVRRKLKKILDSSQGLDKLYHKVSHSPLLALKIHAGEEGNNGYIPPDYLKQLPDELRRIGFVPFLTDTNVLYHGKRMNSVDHLNIFRKHRFHKLNLPIIIADGLMGNDYLEVTVNGKYFESVKIAKGVHEADAILGLTHLTGHMLSGFGGAIKNIGMGCASRAGKMQQHCSLSPNIKYENCKMCGACFNICPVNAIKKKEDRYVIDEEECIGCAQCINVCRFDGIKIVWDEDSTQFQYRMVEYTYGALENKDSFFITFASFITKDCDCLNKAQNRVTKDIGILASFDPVALDKAGIDLVNEQEGKDLFRQLWPGIDYNIQLRYAQEIGLGKMEYELVEVK